MGFGSEEESFEGGGEVGLVFGVEALGGFAGDSSGLVAEEDAVDDGADGLLFVGVEVVDGFEAEVPFGVLVAGFVGVEDELIGERGLDDTVVAVAACHSLLGHSGDWSVGPELVVSARLDLVRAAEVVDSGAVSRADAEQIESFLFDRADADVDPATIARETTVRTPVVEEYLQLRSQAPSPAALAKFAVYAQNETQMVQRIVVVSRQGLVDVDFDGLSRQYSSVEYQLARDGEVRSYDKSDCARLVQE